MVQGEVKQSHEIAASSACGGLLAMTIFLSRLLYFQLCGLWEGEFLEFAL
jgi:hypothetical protein